MIGQRNFPLPLATPSVMCTQCHIYLYARSTNAPTTYVYVFLPPQAHRTAHHHQRKVQQKTETQNRRPSWRHDCRLRMRTRESSVKSAWNWRQTLLWVRSVNRSRPTIAPLLLQSGDSESEGNIFLNIRDRKTKDTPKCCIMYAVLNGRLKLVVMVALFPW